MCIDGDGDREIGDPKSNTLDGLICPLSTRAFMMSVTESCPGAATVASKWCVTGVSVLFRIRESCPICPIQSAITWISCFERNFVATFIQMKWNEKKIHELVLLGLFKFEKERKKEMEKGAMHDASTQY